MIISTETFDKIQHLFIIKALKKQGIEGSYLNNNKDYKQQTSSQHYTEWGKIESISSKIRNETRISTLSILIKLSS
jgi:hypothetical protein